MKRVFVTGATGFIGSYVARKLVADGYEVGILARLTSNFNRLEDIAGLLHRFEGTCEDPLTWSHQLEAWKPDTVIHCAWAGVQGRQGEDPGQEPNIEATLNVLRAAAQAGAKAWVGLGSQAEYGPVDAIITEDTPLHPTSFYGKAKVEAGARTSALARELGLRYAWLRVFSTYGPHDSPWWMLPTLIEKLLSGETPSLTAGEQLWDYLYVTDAAAAIVAVATTESAGGIFNLGSGTAPPLKEIVTKVRDLIDPSLPLGLGLVAYRPDQVMILQADITRLKAATGWKPEVMLERGLADTIAWHRQVRHLADPLTCP